VRFGVTWLNLNNLNALHKYWKYQICHHKKILEVQNTLKTHFWVASLPGKLWRFKTPHSAAEGLQNKQLNGNQMGKDHTVIQVSAGSIVLGEDLHCIQRISCRAVVCFTVGWSRDQHFDEVVHQRLAFFILCGSWISRVVTGSTCKALDALLVFMPCYHLLAALTFMSTPVCSETWRSRN